MKRRSLIAMVAVTILVLCAVSALGHPTEYSPAVSLHIEESLIEFFDTNRDAAVQATREMSKLSQNFLTTTKDFLDDLVLFTSPAFFGDSILEFLEDGSKSVSDIPIIGQAIEIGGEVLETGAYVLLTVGKNLINAAKHIGPLDLNHLDSVGHTHTEAFEEASDKSSKQYVSEEVDIINVGYQKTVEAVDSASDGLL